MSSGNGVPEAIRGMDVEQMNAMREAQARAIFMQRREALAGIILNGICAGLYRNIEDQIPAFGDQAVRHAVQFADKLMAELVKPPA